MSDRLALQQEIRRKLIHLATSIIPMAYYFGLPRKYILFLSFLLAAGFLSADLLRLNFTLARKYFLRIFSSLLRVAEVDQRLTGATYLFLGMAATFLLFPKDAAMPAVLFMTLADPMAAIVGNRLGSEEYFGKTIEGALGFYLTASAIILVFTDYSWLGLGVAFVAALIEFLPIGINDNLTIPVATGYLLMVLG